MSSLYFLAGCVCGVLAALLGRSSAWETPEKRARILELISQIIDLPSECRQRIVFVVANVVAAMSLSLIGVYTIRLLPPPVNIIFGIVVAFVFLAIPLINAVLTLRGVDVRELSNTSLHRLAFLGILFLTACLAAIGIISFGGFGLPPSLLFLPALVIGLFFIAAFVRNILFIPNGYILMVVDLLMPLPEGLLTILQAFLRKCVVSDRDPFVRLALGFSLLAILFGFLGWLY